MTGANQPIPGTGIFSFSTVPPASRTLSRVASMSSVAK